MGSGRDSQSIWVVRAGEGGEAKDLVLSRNVVVLGDIGFGDLNILPESREAFYNMYRKLKPNVNRWGVSGVAGKYYRFVHQMEVGDLVIYPSIGDKQIHVGKILGKYRFSNKLNSRFPHQRPVKWLTTISKLDLSLSAQREMGAARTLFELRRHKQEILRLLRKSPKGT